MPGKKGKGRGKGTSEPPRPTTSAAISRTAEDFPPLTVASSSVSVGRSRAVGSRLQSAVMPQPGPVMAPLPERPATSLAIAAPTEQSTALGASSEVSTHEQFTSNIPSELGEYQPIARPTNVKGQPQFVKLGKRLVVKTNHFKITLEKGKGFIFVYDIDITPACNKTKKRAIFDSAWKDPKNYFLVASGSNRIPGYGFDGNKNLYTSVKLDSVLGKDIKLNGVGDKDKNFTIKINKLTAIRNLKDLLDPTVDDDTRNAIIAALDVVMLTRAKVEHGASIKRSFYYQPDNPYLIAEDTKEIWAGFYTSARQGQWGLTLNADVTASVVIASMTMLSICEYYKGNVNEINTYMRGLKKDIKLDVCFGQAPKRIVKQTRTFERVVLQTAKNHSFVHEGKTVTVLQYYLEQYGERLRYPDHPLVQIKSGKGNVYFPMEFCVIAPGQLSIGKLEASEQSQLVKYVTMKPGQRFLETTKALRKLLSPEQIDVLNDFGIKVETAPMQVEAKVLPPVTVNVKSGDIKCDEYGAKFNMGNSKFYQSPTSLGAWAVVITTRRFGNQSSVQWISQFRQGLQGKGIGAPEPSLNLTAFSAADIEKCFQQFKSNGIKFALFFVEKGGPLYGAIKQRGDRQYQIATQCVDALNRRNTDRAYIENLILKVNVKLGGINHILSPKTFVEQRLKPLFNEDVLLVGADVTHPGRDELSKPSIAAVVGSIDRQAAKYVAVITPQSRTAKEEQVCTQEWISDLAPTMKSLLRAYLRSTGKTPQKIIFYRDGVSEGQYATVLQKELTQIQKACRELDPTYEPLITYIVVRKRIKTKFYQEGRGQMENVPPGTIVEVDITQPLRYFDYFLVPHFSMLGTARPSHYVVLYDDSRFTPDDVAYLSFSLCHLFPRCTKAVSLPAPVYHAHLAAERANNHLAGKPMFGSQSGGNIAMERKKLLDHANDATRMDIENSMPNYWL